MVRDICNAEVDLPPGPALTAWNALIRAFLAHGRAAPDHLAATLAAAPGFAMGLAAKGLFCLLLGRAEMVVAAREARAAARRAADRGASDARTRLWIGALGAWLAGRPSEAVAAMEEVLALNPADTLSAKMSHAIRFVLGDGAGMRASLERVLPAHGGDHPLRGFLLGCYAFALEETGDYAGAERAGREGLEVAPDDAWGLHAVAHVHDAQARPDAGIALIDAHRDAWEHCNNFRYHVWWHKALLHLDKGDCEAALALYDRRIRAEKTDDYRDIANATSLLMRLGLEGMDVGARWEELAELSARRIDDGCLVFADLHYMLALVNAGGGRQAAAVTAMRTRYARDAAGQGQGEMAARVVDPGQAAMDGLYAFGEARFDDAFRQLCAAKPAMQSIGGSHAQRDVFERMTIDAGLRAGHYDAVEVLIGERSKRRGAEDRFAGQRRKSIADARRRLVQ